MQGGPWGGNTTAKFSTRDHLAYSSCHGAICCDDGHDGPESRVPRWVMINPSTVVIVYTQASLSHRRWVMINPSTVVIGYYSA